MTAPGNRQLHVDAVTTYIATHLERACESSGGQGSSWFRTGAPSDELNAVLRLGGDLPAEIERLRDLFDGIPASWHFWRDIDSPEIPSLLTQSGLALFETEPLMLFTGTGESAPHDLGQHKLARIEQVTDDLGLAQWAALWSDTTDTDALVAGLRQGFASTRYLVWRDRGDVLGCAAVVTSPAGASIEHIVTRADHRGHGIGTALTRRALDV